MRSVSVEIEMFCHPLPILLEMQEDIIKRQFPKDIFGQCRDLQRDNEISPQESSHPYPMQYALVESVVGSTKNQVALVSFLTSKVKSKSVCEFLIIQEMLQTNKQKYETGPRNTIGRGEAPVT